MVLEVMRLGEPVLMKEALPVRDFGSPRLRKLVADMWDTMHAEGGVGIAAPQVGVSERIICFGFEASSRYPDAPLMIGRTAGRGASPYPACAGLCRVPGEFATPALDWTARPSSERPKSFMPEWCSMSLTT